MAYEDIKDSSGWISYILFILSIGMSYYQGGCNSNHRQVSSAQTNRTQVLTLEKHLPLHLHLLILGLFSAGLGSPRNKLSGMSKITENEVRSKKLWLFLWGELCCFWEGSSAALQGWQCRPCTVIMASFRILMASLSGMSIYTHPRPLVMLLMLQTFQTLSKALCELSLTLSLWD
jgi:hypothetical protein